MSNFREFMAEDMSHLGACLFAASESARKILNFKVPATEGRIRKHEEIEMEFDLQLKHLREYLNGMWRGEQADEYDGPPQAIDEVGEGPRRVRMPLIAGPVAESSFEITGGTAWAMKYLAQGIIKEVDDYLDDPDINGSDCLDHMALALFAFLWAIKKEDPAEG